MQTHVFGDALDVPEIGVSLKLTDIYAGIDLPPITDDGSA
jgi:hypothetical protein